MIAISDWLDRKSLYIALVAAWVATLGSLYFSEVAHYVPCVLCWYQRILMYPLALIIAIGILRKDENLPIFILPFSLPGLGIAIYHYLLEKTNLFDSAATCQAGVPCTTQWINWFGFITIPFLSLVGFLIITLMTVIALHAGEPTYEEETPTPWLPVFSIIVVLLLTFGILARINRRPVQTAQAAFSVINTTPAPSQSHDTPANTTSGTDAGAKLYQQACAGCHGPKAEGVPQLGTALVNSDFIHQQSDEAMLKFLRTGRAANAPDNKTGLAMPPSGGRPDLSDEELLAIVHYLHNAK